MLVVILWVALGVVQAQTGFRDPKFKEIAASVSSPNFVKLDTTKRINPKALFEDYSELFGLDSNKTMEFVRMNNGITGEYYCFQCVYKGFIVEGYEAMVHAKDGAARSIAFNIPGLFSLNVHPLVTESDALNVIAELVFISKLFFLRINTINQKQDDLRRRKRRLFVNPLNQSQRRQSGRFFILRQRTQYFNRKSCSIGKLLHVSGDGPNALQWPSPDICKC